MDELLLLLLELDDDLLEEALEELDDFELEELLEVLLLLEKAELETLLEVLLLVEELDSLLLSSDELTLLVIDGLEGALLLFDDPLFWKLTLHAVKTAVNSNEIPNNILLFFIIRLSPA